MILFDCERYLFLHCFEIFVNAETAGGKHLENIVEAGKHFGNIVESDDAGILDIDEPGLFLTSLLK